MINPFLSSIFAGMWCFTGVIFAIYYWPLFSLLLRIEWWNDRWWTAFWSCPISRRQSCGISNNKTRRREWRVKETKQKGGWKQSSLLLLCALLLKVHPKPWIERSPDLQDSWPMGLMAWGNKEGFILGISARSSPGWLFAIMDCGAVQQHRPGSGSE